MTLNDLKECASRYAVRLITSTSYAGLVGFCTGILANPAQEQACAGEVSYMQDVSMSEARVEYSNPVGGGTTQVLVSFPGGNARCSVLPDGDVSEIRWNVHDSGGGMADTPQPDMIGMEQACAGRMSEEIDEPMSAVREIETTPLKYGHVRVLLEYQGVRAACTVDADYNVVSLKFLP